MAVLMRPKYHNNQYYNMYFLVEKKAILQTKANLILSLSVTQKPQIDEISNTYSPVPLVLIMNYQTALIFSLPSSFTLRPAPFRLRRA